MATYESRRYAIIPINATQIADGSVSNSEFQTVDTSSSINTQLGTKVPLAGGTMTGTLAHDDNVKSTFGTGADLEIFHDSNNSIIKNGTGTLKFLEDTTEFKNNADNSTFLSINSSGVTGDFISGQTSTSSAASSDEIILKNGSGNIRRITIANAALQGPTGSPGSPGGTGGTGPPGPPGPAGSAPNSTTAVGALRMFVHPTDKPTNGSDTPHTAGSSYSGSVLSNYFFSGTTTSRACKVSGSAIGTGTWLCLGPSGRFRGSGGGDTFNFRWPGLFLRTS
tara:strand:+ start:2928 stop:3767 length:840 start_codon:yes stop_codon:yes gene_type:complete